MVHIGFRPLPGSFLFHLFYGWVWRWLWIIVSVPCRGLFYFIKIADLDNLPDCRYSFRPLPGSFLFHNKINKEKKKLKKKDSDPSTVIFYLIIKKNRECQSNWKVSVPCRGLFYFIDLEEYLNEELFSFRPLPGSFLFHQVEHKSNKYFTFKFPSPAGVFFISSTKYLTKIIKKDTGFPSPAGVFFISSLRK